MAQPLKKKDVKGFSVKGLKSNMGIAVETPKDIEKSNADKEIEWITLPEAYQEAVKLPGIPMGYMSGVRGWSDTGKSTIKNCLIAEAMRMGILPVIFETEGNFDFNYARDCGMNVKPVYGDVEEEDEATRRLGSSCQTEQLSGRSKKPNLRDRKRKFQEGENRPQCQMQVNQEQIETTGLSSFK